MLKIPLFAHRWLAHIRRPHPARRYAGGWAMGLLLVGLIVLLDLSTILDRPDRLLQDAWIRMQTHDVSEGEVVIVAIDDTSVAALGVWPWSRTLHAELIDRISQAQPKAIGLNMLFLESSGSADIDQRLADSLQRSGKVVLPLLMQSINDEVTTVEPMALLAHAAAALGHVHLDLDEDGVARATYKHEGQRGQLWPHMALAMQQLAQGKTLPHPQHEEFSPLQLQVPTPNWQREDRSVIAFAGAAHHFPTVSYVDALEGRVPPELFRGRYVLIGATAVGTADFYATPVSGHNNLMSGVEITANVLSALLEQRIITPLSPLANGLVNALAVALVLLGLATLGPLAALSITLLLLLLLPALSAAALLLAQLQYAPSAGMVGVALAYALWSWQRLNAASRYLIEEFESLRDNTELGRWVGAQPLQRSGDFLSRRISALDQATEHLHDLYRLLRTSLKFLPDAALVCDLQGEVLLANLQAAQLLGLTKQDLQGQSVVTLLQNVKLSHSDRPALPAQQLTPGLGTQTIEARDNQERDLLLKLAPSRNAANLQTGWLISLVDISDLRRAQRQRADAIRFLGHDIRAPQAAILTLIELRRHDPTSTDLAQFEARIERHARKTLKLADDFIQLLRAQSHDYRLEAQNLGAIVEQCMDDSWETAAQRQIQLQLDADSALEAWVLGDRELLTRALDNLIGNALKFAPIGSSVRCRIEAAPVDERAGWHVTVHDQGPGISVADQARLFTPFARGSLSTQADGAGLGLAFVKSVAERHSGRATLQSVYGHGACFGLLLPRLDEQSMPCSVDRSVDQSLSELNSTR